MRFEERALWPQLLPPVGLVLAAPGVVPGSLAWGAAGCKSYSGWLRPRHGLGADRAGVTWWFARRNLTPAPPTVQPAYATTDRQAAG